MATIGTLLPKNPVLGQPVTPLQALSATNALGLAQGATLNLNNLKPTNIPSATVPASKPVVATATAPAINFVKPASATPTKSIYRVGADIYDATSNQKLAYNDFMANYNGRSTDLGQRPAISPVVPAAPVVPAKTATQSEIYGTTFETPEEKAARDRITADALAASNQTVDPAAIRTETMSRFQNEIDALNRSYAEQKRLEGIVGQNRLGQVGAIGNRRGLLGSDFGVAQENTQVDANTASINAIEAERLAGEQAIYAKAEDIIQAAITKKETAKRSGSDDYLKYLSSQTAAKKAAAEEIAKMWYTSKLDEPSNLKDIADKLGVSIETLRATYKNYAAGQVKDNVKLSAGESIYNPNTGKVEFTAPTDEKPISMSPGSVLVDAKGNALFSAPDKPTNPLDYVKQVGDYTYQYNPATGNTTVTKSAKSGEIVKIDGVDWQKNADGTYTKPVVDLGTPDTSKTMAQLALVKKSLTNASNLSNAAGRSGLRKGLEKTFVGSTDYTNLIAETNTLRTNVLTMMTDPSIKKFFGPQMSNADVELMTAAGTTLNPELQDPESLKAELDRLADFVGRAEEAVKAGSASTVNNQVSPPTEDELQQLMQYYPGQTREQILQSFTNVGSDTNSATFQKAVSKADGTKGGQCGRFVNNLTGLKLGDSFQSKMAKMDPNITWPEPGMVFTMPYKDTGHTGIIVAVNPDNTVTVKDSNYNLDEKVKTHNIAMSKITGLVRA